jgi:hypothetical protein
VIKPEPLPDAARAAATSLLLVLSAAATPVAAQQPSFGPLTWEEGSPLQRLAFTVATEGADVVGEGAWSVELYNGFSNIFEQDSTATHTLFLDMERLTTALTIRWGAGERLEVGGRTTLESTGAGVLDDVILAFHDGLGFGQANRDRFPSGAYRQWLSDGDDRVYLDRPPGTLGLRDVRLFAKWRAWRSADGRSLLSLRSVGRLPVRGPPESNGRPDGALMGLWRLGVGSWYTHGMVGLSVTPASAPLEPVLRGHSTFLTLALERSLGSDLAALVQLQTQSAALRSFHNRELDRAPTNVLVGVAGRMGREWTWDASFQEDVPADTPAVDFTLTLRVGRRW